MSKLSSGEQFLELLHSHKPVATGRLIYLTLQMSFPAIVAQISSVIMQYVDASMLGHLGSDKAASVGLVASTIWLLSGLGFCLNTGYYVQAAQQIGADCKIKARSIMKQGYLISTGFGVVVALIGLAISGQLPVWLGGEEKICSDASWYLGISCLLIPFLQINRLSTGLLQSTGNMHLPSILNTLACVLDVVFNFFLIFDCTKVDLGYFSLEIPGFGLGVIGAALGTLIAEIIVSCFMLYFVLKKSRILHLRSNEHFIWNSNYFRRTLRLALPIGFEHVVMCGAMVVSTVIVSSLGSVSIAAHSFAITAESFCYMAGYGISSAASTIMGQTIGAMRRELAVRFAWIVTFLGVAIMTCTAVFMYAGADLMIGLMTPDPQIQHLGAEILRIEAWAEPLFAASIVISGVLRGSGDTLLPSCLNFGSMWLVRLPLSFLLAGYLGLYGVWVAMSLELCVRGILLLLRLKNGAWLNKTTHKDLR